MFVRWKWTIVLSYTCCFPHTKFNIFSRALVFPWVSLVNFSPSHAQRDYLQKKKGEAAFFSPSPRDNRGKAQKYFSLHSTTQNYPHTRKKHMQSGKECSTDLFPCRRRGPDWQTKRKSERVFTIPVGVCTALSRITHSGIQGEGKQELDVSDNVQHTPISLSYRLFSRSPFGLMPARSNFVFLFFSGGLGRGNEGYKLHPPCCCSSDGRDAWLIPPIPVSRSWNHASSVSKKWILLAVRETYIYFWVNLDLLLNLPIDTVNRSAELYSVDIMRFQHERKWGEIKGSFFSSRFYNKQ